MSGGHGLRLYYGGTFDPVHEGHLAIARAARDELGVDVRFVPAADPPHRALTGADAEQRGRMLDLAVAGEHGLRVDRRELLRAGVDPSRPSYTVDTLRELLRTASLARAQARGANLAAEMKSQGIWESRQAPFRRALQRHASPVRWERFVAVASRIDRAAKGRGDGDPWVALERMLMAVAESRAVRLLVA